MLSATSLVVSVYCPVSLFHRYSFYSFVLLCIGVRAGGERGQGGTAARPKFGLLRVFGQQEKFGESKKKRSLHVYVCVLLLFFFFRKERFSILNLSQRGKAS